MHMSICHFISLYLYLCRHCPKHVIYYSNNKNKRKCNNDVVSVVQYLTVQ